MTTSNYKKVLRQIKAKKAKKVRFEKFNSPKERSTGRSKWPCVRCGRFGGHSKKYGLNLCRTCFREIATKIGFKKYS